MTVTSTGDQQVLAIVTRPNDWSMKTREILGEVPRVETPGITPPNVSDVFLISNSSHHGKGISFHNRSSCPSL